MSNNDSTIDVTNAKKTINTCFLSEHYVVPPFQREYVWAESEIELLLNDLEEAYNSNKQKEYFLGTMVVFEKDGKKQLIDGQQRMTTFFLILCAISKRYEDSKSNASAFQQLINTPVVDSEGNTENRFTLELQYEASTDCLANVWKGTIPDKTDSLSKSSQRIYEGFETIQKKLNSDFSDFDEYKRFASYFINKVVFIQIGANNMADALKIFETINQRGKGLNPLDLLKNMLFMQIKEDTFNKLNDKWKQMIDKLEEMDEKPLRFLRYYLTATYDITNVSKDKDFQGIIKEDDIYRWLHDNDNQCMYKADPIRFTDNLLEGLDRYKEYLSPSETTPGRDYLNNITFLMGNSFRLHLVSLMAAKGWETSLFVGLCRAFETIIYCSVVNDVKSNALEKLFSSWCPKIRKVQTQEDFDSFYAQNIKPTLANWNTYYYQNFMGIGLGKLQRYKIKAILARMTKYIDDSRNGGKDSIDIRELIKSKNEIEHIMPQSCGNPQLYGFDDQTECDMYKNRLGNLTLLEKTLNGTIGNDSYDSKCAGYDNSAFYLTKSLNGLVSFGNDTAINRTNALLKSWSAWNQDSINQRQEMLYNLSKYVWDIS